MMSNLLLAFSATDDDNDDDGRHELEDDYSVMHDKYNDKGELAEEYDDNVVGIVAGHGN